MAIWDNDTCGYCGYSDTDLPKYVCPVCNRTGCSDCMPDGEEERCNQCDDNFYEYEAGFTSRPDI